MKLVWAPVFFVLGSLCFSQAQDKRTYDQVINAPNKTVVDYFLLCPQIVLRHFNDSKPQEVGVLAPEDGSQGPGPQGFLFRQNLLSPGKKTENIKVTSALVDLKNVYIKIEGTHFERYKFSLTFVYFERADKSRIPALTFSYTAMEEEDYLHQFFDIRDGSWKLIPDKDLFPPISEKSLIPFAGPGDASNVSWILELPQYGTTVRFLPVRADIYDQGDKEAETSAFLERVKSYSLECPWNKPQARFDGPIPAPADKTDVPKGKAVAADFFALLPRVPGLSDVLPSDTDRRRARDSWKSASTDGKGKPADSFRWEAPKEQGNEGVDLKVLGQSRGLPLIAEVNWLEEIYNLDLWLYHPDSGLLESADGLLKLSLLDFYQDSRKNQIPSRWFKIDPPIVYSLDLENGKIHANLDVWHDQSIRDFPPDFEIDIGWNGQAFTIEKTKSAYGEQSSH